MKYLHTMVRVTDVDASLGFYCDALGLEVLSSARTTRRASSRSSSSRRPATARRRSSSRTTGSRSPTAAAATSATSPTRSTTSTPTCERLQKHGVTINRPPRDGRMAFVRSPDNISIELLQKDGALPPREPWVSMANTGVW